MIVYIVTFTILILFFPLVVSGYIYYDGDKKRLNMGVYLFGFIKLVGAYVVGHNKDFIIHYSNKRAKLFKKKDMGKLKIKLKDLKHIELFNSKLLVSFPKEQAYIAAGSVIVSLSNLVCPIFTASKKFEDYKSTVMIGYDENVQVYYHIKIALNLVILIYILIRVLINEKE